MSTSEQSPWVERRYTDLHLHVQMRVRSTIPNEVEYEVRELSHDDDGDGDPFKFNCTTNTGGGGTTSYITASDVYIQGAINSDGKSVANFGDGKGYILGGQREHLTRLGPLFERLYDWAIKLLGDDGKRLAPRPL